MNQTKDYFNGTSEKDKKIIHLYVLDKCTHHCKFCCNKEYSTENIPVVTVNELKAAENICLTGGEPFLLDSICDFAKTIKTQYPNIKTIFVYSCGDSLYQWLECNKTLHDIDGVNLAPKNKFDLECIHKIFRKETYLNQIISLRSNRIYLFPNIREHFNLRELQEYESMNIIDRDWQEDFVPGGGIFRRLPILMEVGK